MSKDENIINTKIGKSKNKLWSILSTIIKSLIVLLIIGFIMVWISDAGSEIYVRDSYDRNSTSGWGYHEYLHPVYGTIGIIIYILINFLGFLSYNHITNRFKNYKTIISKIMFILFSIFINLIMLIMYFRLFGGYSFKNRLLELFNNIIICYGYITFPAIFLIIYIYRKKLKNKNMNVKIIHDPKQATGLAIIIDVFRAFTVEPYLIYNGVERLIPVGDKEIAYNLKEKNKEYILIGERNGIKLLGFDYGNSPSEIKNVDFSKRTVVHTTSCGTQGIVNAINADEIITGSLVNAKAIVKYIKQNNFKDISIVSMSTSSEPPSDEDELCAKYIKSLLEDAPLENLEDEIEKLKLTSGKKFFDSNNKEVFPREDFYLCIEINKFDFILRVNKDKDGMLYIEKIEI